MFESLHKPKEMSPGIYFQYETRHHFLRIIQGISEYFL